MLPRVVQLNSGGGLVLEEFIVVSSWSMLERLSDGNKPAVSFGAPIPFWKENINETSLSWVSDLFSTVNSNTAAGKLEFS